MSPCPTNLGQVPYVPGAEYENVTVHMFVVGSFGAWDKDNSEAVRDLSIRKGYTKLFYKLCV